MDNNLDNNVDEEIKGYLSFDKPVSFFLFAGAGSGKTRSLVNALNYIRAEYSQHLRINNQKIAVITYTNAACDEIKRRLEFDPLIEVSTIHSFVWSLIHGLNIDIKKWLKQNLLIEIAKLTEKEQNSKKISSTRKKAIDTKQKRLSNVENIKKFIYNPIGNNSSKDSLNHTEVISLGAYFLNEKPRMQDILVGKYPIMLIDESQDTNKYLMDAFLAIQQNHKHHFLLGLFGDTMQRIYGDGKEDLGENLPEDWQKPAKVINHRSPQRIIKLINKIRSSVDEQKQKARTDKEEGVVRLFIIKNDIDNKPELESKIAEYMTNITQDLQWEKNDYKTLAIEHHMIANRYGFLAMFEALYKVDSFKNDFLDGKIPGVRFFEEIIFSLLMAKEKNDKFLIASIVKDKKNDSPLLRPENLQAFPIEQLAKANKAVEKIHQLWKKDENLSFQDILENIAESNLFEIPESLKPFIKNNLEEQNFTDEQDNDDDETSNSTKALGEFLQTPFSQIEKYRDYIKGNTKFITHQGVKGLEFPRVMIILDDDESRGRFFSYDKLFGIEEKSEADLKNIKDGKETVIDRTRRLFYVTCSRAQNSLAIVVYTTEPQKLYHSALEKGWFEDKEIIFYERGRFRDSNQLTGQ